MKWSSFIISVIVTLSAGSTESFEAENITAKEIVLAYKKIASGNAKVFNGTPLAIEEVEELLNLPSNQLYWKRSYTNEEIKITVGDGENREVLTILIPELSRKINLNFVLESQRIYELEIGDLSNGIVRGMQFDFRFTADDCVALALDSYDDGERSRGAAWFREALQRIRIGEECSYVSQSDQIRKILLDPREDISKNSSYMSYKHLCRSKSTSSSDSPQLTCSYIRSSDPRLIFTPTKSEQLSVKPDIILYHDMLPNTYVDKLKQTASADVNEGEYESPLWIMKNAVDTLSNHFSDEFLSALYSPSYYSTFTKANPDLPFHRLQSKFNVIMFLSNVELGGNVVFDHPPISVKPREGSVLFWKNEGSVKMAECPVIIGDKWAAKFVPKGYYEQEYFTDFMASPR